MGLFTKIVEQGNPKSIIFPDAVKYGEKSLVGYGSKMNALEFGEKSLLGQLGDKVYQIIDMGDYYHFICVQDGNFITDFDNPFQVVIEDENDFEYKDKFIISDKNDFSVSKESIFSAIIWVEYGDDDGVTVRRSEIKFNWVAKTPTAQSEYHAFYISLAQEMPFDMLTSFLNGVNDLKIKSYDEYEKPKFNKKQKKICIALYRVSVILFFISLFSSIIALIPMLRTVSALVSIIPLVLFVLYILFTKYFDIGLITDKDQYETGLDVRFQLVHTMALCTVSGFLYHIFNIRPYLDTSNYTSLFFSITGVCLALFLLRSSQARKSLKAFVAVALCIIISVSSSIWLINIMCPSEAVSYTTTITDKYTKAGIKAVSRYRVKANVKGEEMYFGVDRDYYDSLEIGDEITIKEYKGALNIPYVDIDEEK